MARAKEDRHRVRAAYVHERLPLDIAAMKARVPMATVRRWKADAKAAGDDWDQSRAATALGDENFKVLAAQLLEDFLVQHQATMNMLRDAPPGDITALQRTDALASLSDSLAKSMASFRRINPALDRQAVAMDVLRRLIQFATQTQPKAVPVLAELLDAFGTELAKAYA